MLSRDEVIGALKRVKGPDLSSDIVSLGMIFDVKISGSKVVLLITVPPERARDLEPLREAAEQVLRDLPGVDEALVALTANRPPDPSDPKSSARGSSAAPSDAVAPGVPGVGAIVAVASGKGGVGKSTTAVNLALGLQAIGLKVGMLDADIYGPSLPRLLRLKGRPEPVRGRVLMPLEGYGLKVMSMGFLVDSETPMIWRGPMVTSALTQMLREVAWGELDVLVVDMPPGTGDAQLTMAQQVPLAGAVIVSTPQDLALIDARKGINMFKRVNVPVLGIVENMSYFLCPHCGGRTDVFGHGGAASEAARLGVALLGTVPLHSAIRELSDAGTPVVISDPEGEHAGIYRSIAAATWDRVREEREAAGRRPPSIVVEE